MQTQPSFHHRRILFRPDHLRLWSSEPQMIGSHGWSQLEPADPIPSPPPTNSTNTLITQQSPSIHNSLARASER